MIELIRPGSRAAVLAAWVLLALIIVVTVVPVEYRPVTMLPLKVERGLAFAVLAVGFAVAYPRRIVLVIGCLCFAAFAIEFLQVFIPSRDPRLIDALVKAAGAIVGGMLGRAIVRWRLKPGEANS